MTVITVCDTCDYSDEMKMLGDKTGGEIMAEHVERLASGSGIEVRRVSCLMNCSGHCNVSLQAQGKLTYVLGKFDPDEAAAQAVLDYAKAYTESESGQVPYGQWPEGVKGHFVARVPKL